MYKVFRYAGNVNSGDTVAIPDVEIPVIPPKDETSETEVVNEEIEKIDYIEISKQQAQEILREAQIQAQKIIDNAERESKIVLEQAKKQAYDDAFTSQINIITDCLKKTEGKLNEIQQSYDEYINEYSEKLSDLSIEISSVILKKKIEADPIIMHDLVCDVMSNIKDAKWAIVTLSKELNPLIKLLSSELPEKCPTIANIDVDGKEIPITKCIVDTSVGVIDASIDEQIKNLSIRFEQISKKRGTL